MHCNEISILSSSSPQWLNTFDFVGDLKFNTQSKGNYVLPFRFMAFMTHKVIETGVWINHIIQESFRGMGVYQAAYKVFKRYAYRLAREIVEHIILLTSGLSWFWMCSRPSMKRLKKQPGSEYIMKYSRNGWRHCNEINTGIRLRIRKLPRKQQGKKRLEIIVEN
jgi:hypothetical protein